MTLDHLVMQDLWVSAVSRSGLSWLDFCTLFEDVLVRRQAKLISELPEDVEKRVNEQFDKAKPALEGIVFPFGTRPGILVDIAQQEQETVNAINAEVKRVSFLYKTGQLYDVTPLEGFRLCNDPPSLVEKMIETEAEKRRRYGWKPCTNQDGENVGVDMRVTSNEPMNTGFGTVAESSHIEFRQPEPGSVTRESVAAQVAGGDITEQHIQGMVDHVLAGGNVEDALLMQTPNDVCVGMKFPAGPNKADLLSRRYSTVDVDPGSVGGVSYLMDLAIGKVNIDPNCPGMPERARLEFAGKIGEDYVHYYALPHKPRVVTGPEKHVIPIDDSDTEAYHMRAMSPEKLAKVEEAEPAVDRPKLKIVDEAGFLRFVKRLEKVANELKACFDKVDTIFKSAEEVVTPACYACRDTGILENLVSDFVNYCGCGAPAVTDE